MWWWTGKKCGSEGANALASMLLMNLPLTKLNLLSKITTLLDMILKEKNDETHDCVAQITILEQKEQEH